MTTFAEVLAEMSARVSRLTGGRVDVAAMGVTSREGLLPLDPPGRISCNRACRLVRCADGWIAVNLAREEDRDLAPAWLDADFGEDAWELIERLAPGRSAASLVDGAALLGLPAGAVGETTRRSTVVAQGPSRRRGKAPQVIDLSALWAGPMCGAVLAASGCDVTKVESDRRRDPTRTSTPEFHRRLNGAKRELVVDLASSVGRQALLDAVRDADVVITGARPRAFASLGFDPMEISANGGVWVSITGYGWAEGHRVAFGDDAAAAGGLVRWTGAGEPHFLGDALADPAAGLEAATGALELLSKAEAGVVDVGLATAAAGAAARMGLRAVA